MHRDNHFFAISVLRSGKPICLKTQICIEQIGNSAILMHFHAVVPDICLSGEHSKHKLWMIFLQCGTIGSCLLNFFLVV